jgi:hypothetical protein
MVAHEVPHLSQKSHFDPWNESGDRLEGVEFFPQAMFFTTVQAKTGLTGFPNQSDRFRPVGCREVFFSKEVSIVSWLLLF